MKHRVRHGDHPGVVARAGTELAEEFWQDGGWRTCVGRWAVIFVLSASGDVEGRWKVYPTTSVSRFTSLAAARRYAGNVRSRPFRGQLVKAYVMRWRRDLDGASGIRPRRIGRRWPRGGRHRVA